MQNIAKMGVFFAHFPRGAWASFTKVVSNRTNSIFLINFTKCQFNYIIFVKEQ